MKLSKLLTLGLSLILLNGMPYAYAQDPQDTVNQGGEDNPDDDAVREDILEGDGLDKDTMQHREMEKEMKEDEALRH